MRQDAAARRKRGEEDVVHIDAEGENESRKRSFTNLYNLLAAMKMKST